jgi:signal transduction histidine kinase
VAAPMRPEPTSSRDAHRVPDAKLGIYRWSILVALGAFSIFQLFEHFILRQAAPLFRNTIAVCIEVGLTAGIVIVALSALAAEQRRLFEMKNEFISRVSHELRTPLHSIQGFAELLHSDYRESVGPYERDEFIGIILQETRRLLMLVNDLLDVSRMDAGYTLDLNLCEVDLAAIVRRAAMLLSYTTDRHTVAIELPPDLPSVKADPDKVEQILTNLLSNAIKYSPNGGEVVISAGVADGVVTLKVIDHGVGIGPEHLSSIFQRFERAYREGMEGIRGTGLGLYLVKTLVEAQGGRVAVESEPGRGSCFQVALPVYPPDDRQPEIRTAA